MRIRDVDLLQDQVQWPGVRNGRSAGHEDDEGSFAADEVDQQLQEGVNGEGLYSNEPEASIA